MNSLQKLLKELTLAEFLEYFSVLWDQENKKYVPFKLWPSQRAMCDKIEEWHELGFRETIHPKSRQCGFSEMFSGRAVKHGLLYPQSEGLIFSKRSEDAQYFLERRIKPKLENLPKIDGIEWPTIKRMNKELIVLSNGSTFKSFPAANTAGAGSTADYVIFDECGGIDKQPNASFSEMYKNVSPVVEKAGDIAWISQIGTSEPGSYYNDKVKKVWLGQDKETKLYFIGWRGDPKRNDDWYQKQIMKADHVSDVQTQYPETMDDFFAIKEGLIFPNFDPKPGGKHVNEFDYLEFNPSDGYFITGYDHGFRHPAVYLLAFYHKYEDHLYVISEKYWRETVAEDICIDIKNIDIKLERPIKRRIADAAIFNQTGVISPAQVFAQMGVKFAPSDKTRGLIGEDGSRMWLSKRFTDEKITIHPNCWELIDQLNTWRWNPNVKGEKPEDEGDDGPDVLRYLCAEIRKDTPKAPPTQIDLLARNYHGNMIDTTGKSLQSDNPEGGYRPDNRDNDWLTAI